MTRLRSLPKAFLRCGQLGLLLAATSTAAGCYLERTILLKNALGDTATCDTSSGSAMVKGGLALGPVLRDRDLRDCVEHYEAAGYRVVSDSRPGDPAAVATPQEHYNVW